jgi:2-desacetyl-2-hydroxyethyl bacteriochlorophyllide A dehydrogenase
MKAKCIVFTKPRNATVSEVEVPAPGEGQLLCKTRITGVSTGTETRVFRGEQPGAKFPTIPGYENLGEVVETGANTGTPVGSRLFVTSHQYNSGSYARTWGAQVSHTVTPEDRAILVPEGVSDERAVYAKTAGIALHGVKRARVAAGEWVVVVGLGLIGHLVVQHSVAVGAKVIAVDMASDRLSLAEEAGASLALNAGDGDAVDRAREASGGGADVAFDATGIASVFQPTIGYLKERPWNSDPADSPRLVLQGSLEEPLSLDYMTMFMPEIDIIIPRDNDTQDVVDSLDLMARDRIRPEIIPATRYSYRDCAEAYPRLVNREIMRVIYSWD